MGQSGRVESLVLGNSEEALYPLLSHQSVSVCDRGQYNSDFAEDGAAQQQHSLDDQHWFLQVGM